MAEQITAVVEPADVDAALEAYIRGQRLQHCCPVQRALQRQVDRRAVVFKGTWHLAAQEKAQGELPATAGVPLPDVARGFIARFDAWAKAVRDRMLAKGGDVATAIAVVEETAGARRPDPISFSVAVPA